MKFFDHQSRARRNTTTLLVLFGLAILCLVVLTNICIGLQIWKLDTDQIFAARHWPLHFWISVGVVGFIVGVSGFRYFVLRRRGGVSVALELGGVNVDPSTTSPDERRLLNIVEEMSIASGVPMPEVFVFADQSINAFAIGLTREDATIGVTEGALRQLTRDELQGVIGHEFSHILNGDMRLNTRIHACLHGIMAISTVGRILLRGSVGRRHSTCGDASIGSRRSGRGVGGMILLGLGLFVIGLVGTFFGKLIQAAMSRQREYLADASAVQFTRNPQGLAGALRKIMGQSSRSFEGAVWAAELQHIFFVSTLEARFFGWLGTHPPLADRIRRIQNTPEHIEIMPLATRPAGGGATPMSTLRQTASLSLQQMTEPQSLLALLGPTTKLALQEVYSVRSVVYALFLSEDPLVFQQQEQAFAKRLQKPLFAMVQRIRKDLGQHVEQLRLPLIEIAMPTLRRLSVAQVDQFFVLLDDLMTVDGRWAIHEYALLRILRTQLKKGSPKASSRALQKPEIQKAIVMLLSGFVYLGAQDPEGRKSLAQRFAQKLGPDYAATLANFGLDDVKELEGAMDSLQTLPMNTKEAFLEWVADCIQFDGKAQSQELELLRAVAMSLGAPIPKSLRSAYLRVA